MRKSINMLEGSILSGMTRLAIPIMGTSLMQMAYNLIDMIWIGRISSNAVAAVGAAGMYLWLSCGFSTLARMGGQVLVGQSLGAGKKEHAMEYAKGAIWMGIIFGIFFGVVTLLFNGPLIGFFRLNSPQVVWDARVYLMITCGGVVFSFLNQILTGLLTAMGSSAVTFKATLVGLLLNMVLDPVLIFGIGPVPEMGVAGAAIATLFAQIVVFVVFVLIIRKDEHFFGQIKYFTKMPLARFHQIITIGLPVAVQSFIFTGISMVIARLIAGWGDAAVAVQKVGSQIESISWMTAEGFGSAVSAFVSQNYGAGKMKRVKKGYFTAISVMMLWGLFTSFILMVFPEQLFLIFIKEKEIIPMGVDYLRILGVSQLFLCTEMASAGAFQGLGKTLAPSITGVSFNAVRIPLAIVLSTSILGLNGIWWSISITSIFKGTILPIWFISFLFISKKLKQATNIKAEEIA